ncbi:MAG: NHL repeat-containing protein [Chloroflexaceae bacterium]|nr:NHL repeat-containing protein [Chloroflexaceae bacterium]
MYRSLLLRAGCAGLIVALLAACATGLPAAPAPSPSPVATVPPPSPTPIRLDATLRLEEAGVELRYPDGWATRVVSSTATLAPSAATLAGVTPGDELLVTVDATPLEVLVTRFGPGAVTNPESFFEVSSSAAQEAGYLLSATSAISVDGYPGLSADLTAARGAGRLTVLIGPNTAVRMLGQAAPEAWAADGAELYAAILASVRFFPPTTSTPVTVQQAEQPPILTAGPAGFVLRLGGGSGPPRGRFVSARGLATAPDGTLYLAESSRGVWVFAPDGALVGTFGGEELLDAYDVARAPDGDLFVADYGRNAIARFRADGTFVGRWGGPGNAPEQFGFSSPQRIALGPDGSVYALDTRPGPESGRVVSSVARFDPAGSLRERIELPADLAPADLAVDGAGYIYLADSFSGVVVKLDPRGAEVARFGDPAARESFASGAIDLDEQGNIYVATYAAGVLKLAPSGVVIARGGRVVAPGKIPAPGEFSLPNGIAVGPGGVVWVSDNSGEYSAVTALRLTVDEAAVATALAQPASGTPGVALPSASLLRQWAGEARASSFYAPDYDPAGVIGPPDVEGCQDSPDAWAAAAPDTLETLEVRFDTPVFAVGLNVYQSYHPGFISKIELLDERGEARTVYSATPAPAEECPGVLSVTFAQTLTRIVGARLTVDQRAGATWAEIDAVELLGVP